MKHFAQTALSCTYLSSKYFKLKDCTIVPHNKTNISAIFSVCKVLLLKLF